MKVRPSILIAVLCVVATIGAFWVTRPKAAPQLNEYRNEELGYSFHYPATCTFGPMPGACKQTPPEEMPEECLCFLNAEDPNHVFLQTFQDAEDSNLVLSSFTITHTESPAFNPPPNVELATWLKANFSEMYTNIPETPNTTLGGKPVIAIRVPPTPSIYSHEDIFFIKDSKLFLITMLNVDNARNKALYDQILSTFSWEK